MTDLQSKQRIAFVCSGGAVKAAAFHVGVVLALQERGFQFLGGKKAPEDPIPAPPFKGINIYVGSSAGSFIVSCLAAGFSVESITSAFGGKKYKAFTQMIQSTRQLRTMGYATMLGLLNEPARRIFSIFRPPRYEPTGTLWGFESLLRKALRVPGFFSTAGIETYLRKNVLSTNAFNELSAELYVTATQLNHSRKVIFGMKDIEKSNFLRYSSHATISQAVAASMSLPPFFEPYAIPHPQKKRKIYYIDGEVRETLSTHAAKDAGADLIIASYTHQPYHYIPEIGSLTDYGLPAICVQALYQAIEQKIHAAQRRMKKKYILFDVVSEFFDQNGLSSELKDQMISKIEEVFNFKRNLDYIYIHPQARDVEMFFGDHFSLSPKSTERIVRIGFRCAQETLRNHGV